MRKYISFTIALSMLLSIVSCRRSEKTTPETDNSDSIISEFSENAETDENDKIVTTVKTSVKGKDEKSTEKSDSDSEYETTPKYQRPKKEPVEQRQINEFDISTYEMDIQTEDMSSFLSIREIDASGLEEQLREYMSGTSVNVSSSLIKSYDILNLGYCVLNDNYVYFSSNEYINEIIIDDEGNECLSGYGSRSHVFSYDIENSQLKLLDIIEWDVRNDESEREYLYGLYLISDELYAVIGEKYGESILYKLDKNTGERVKKYSFDLSDGFVEAISDSEIRISKYNGDKEIIYEIYDIYTGEMVDTYTSTADIGDWVFSFRDGSHGRAIANNKERTIKLECDEYSVELSGIPNVTGVYMTQERANIISTEKISSYTSYDYLYSYNFETMECVKMNVDGYGTPFIQDGNNLIGHPSAYGNDSILPTAYYIVPEIGRAFKIGKYNGNFYRMEDGKYALFRMPRITYTQDGVNYLDHECKICILDSRNGDF